MIEVQRASKEQWLEMAEVCHQACFNERYPVEWNRVDFALVGIDNEKRMMVGYVTCREHDHETIYWQYGGSFPEFRGSTLVVTGYKLFIEWCREHYKRITTLIENTNAPMLKMAAHCGFIIVGIRNYKGKVLLEHGIEFAS